MNFSSTIPMPSNIIPMVIESSGRGERAYDITYMTYGVLEA